MKLLLAAALVALASPALAETVELPVRVVNGDIWIIESNRVRVDDRKDGPRRVETATRYKATYREGTAGGPRIILNATGGFFLGELPGGMKLDGFDLPLEVEVDEALTPVRLKNWPQVRDLVYKLLVNEDPKVVAAARSLFDGLSDEVAVAMFLPQMSFLGLGQGLAVEVNKPVSYEDSLPNPLGGPAITAPSVLTLESYDPRTQQADVVWTQALDPQSMAASMKVSVRWLLERMNAANDAAKVEAAMRDTSMSRESRCRFVIDGGSGLARKADCSAVIEIAAQGQRSRRTDTWTITQTLPEKR